MPEIQKEKACQKGSRGIWSRLHQDWFPVGCKTSCLSGRFLLSFWCEQAVRYEAEVTKKDHVNALLSAGSVLLSNYLIKVMRV